MGRHIYEHYTGEHLWKYVFGRQPSELYRVAEILEDPDYEVNAYDEEKDESLQFESIGEVPDDLILEGDTLLLSLEQIDELENYLNNHDIEELHKQYAGLLYDGKVVHLYGDTNKGALLNDLHTKEEWIEMYTNSIISYGYNDTPEMLEFVQKTDYDFLSMIHNFVKFGKKPENIEAIKEANPDEPKYLIEAEIN